MQEANAAGPKEYIREGDVAASLGLSVRTVQGWRARGDGPKFVKLGRGKRSRVVYSAAAIAAFIADNSFQSTTQAAAKARPTSRSARGRSRG